MTAINIRGTGGSGKSTLVRRIMERYQRRDAVMRLGRKKPIGYICSRDDGSPLFVPGHYETACGGCDTIKTPGEVYELIRTYVGAARPLDLDVLYEGIMVMDDVTRAVELSKEVPLQVVYLATPMDECLAGIQARRDARGEEKPLNPKNTIDRAKRAERGLGRLRDAGVAVYRLGREEAFEHVRRQLGV